MSTIDSAWLSLHPEPALFGVRVEFIMFAAILLGIAVFHHRTLRVAVIGLVTVTAYEFFVTGFNTGPGLRGLAAHFSHEWVILTNLLLLLVAFALLARHFEESGIPDVLPRFIPHDWKGGFCLLAIVFVLSSFLDNIAGAMIGGAMAHTLFRGKVHIGYLAAIVGASNAGGAGSVLGDTTTTMMWIDGISLFDVLPAYVGAAVALLVLGIPAAIQQQRHSPIARHEIHGRQVDWPRVGVVAFTLAVAVATNAVVNVGFPAMSDRFPFIGLFIAAALLLGAAVRSPDWEIVPEAAKGSLFLLTLVACATLMPVEELPGASPQTALGLGFLSAVFDNIPLTALTLKQGGYDWGVLAYAVGFGGSMIWFGSSAGVALSNIYPEARSVFLWLRHGWHVALGYVIGFAALLLIVGWHPQPPHKVRDVSGSIERTSDTNTASAMALCGMTA